MSADCTATLSAQELAIESGKNVMHGEVTDRVLRLFEAIRAAYKPRVTLERAALFTESFKTTEGQPLVLRWAKALKHIAEHIPVTIFDDELIVGRPNTWLGRYTLVYPELDGSIMKAGAETFMAAELAGKPDAVHVTPEDKKIIDEELFPYGGSVPKIATADVASTGVLKNIVVFGSVNANKRHWYKAGETLARADRKWLAQLITRREGPKNFAVALERNAEDIKVILQFSEA